MPLIGTGILRIFQKPCPVRFLGEAFLFRQHARHHAADGVRHGHGGDLAARDDEVSHREFFVHALVDEALVDALVVAADENQMVIALFQLARHRLREGAPAGREIDGMAS